MKEFIVLMAYLTALVALSIDAMLPALGIMAGDLGVTRPNDIQYVVGFIFIGMTLGQLVYGPISDSIGRRPTLYVGLALFACGSALSWGAQDLPMMLAGRFIQGLGVAAPRILTMAIVRDKFQGREMAYVMSLVMGVFIMVPAIAPSIGQAILHIADWRAIFLFYIAATALGAVWFSLRLDETLPPAKRRAFSVKAIALGFKEACTTRVTLGYTLCSGLVFSALLGYLNSTQQVFHEIFHAGEMFSIYFGLLALAIGAAFFTNSALVRKFGMRRITFTALIIAVANAFIFLVYLGLAQPALWAFLLFAALSFFCMGLTFGNMGAMALEPMGHIAGLASAFMGSVSTAVSISIGILIGQLYNGTLLPMALGFFVLGLSGILVMIWTEKGIPREHPENRLS